VFIPEKRQKLIYGQIRKVLGEVLHGLASRKGAEILEKHMMRDHTHMCISIPPKYSVSHVVGYIKGKGAIAIAGKFRRTNMASSWAFPTRG
jgi:putative transposase